MAKISGCTIYIILDNVPSCCHYNYHEAMKRNAMDVTPELVSPSCLQFHPENISMPKHSSPAKVIITNSPVNNTATQLEKMHGSTMEREV